MLNRIRIFVAGCASALALISSNSLLQANDPSQLSSGLTVEINLGQFKETAIGKKLVQAAKSRAQQELGDNMRWEDVHQSLGFDPFDEIQRIALSVDSLDSPENSAVLSVDLKSTTGNLEGLMLAAPGYDSTRLENCTIHQSEIDGKRVYAMVSGESNGPKTIHLSLNQSRINALAQTNNLQTLVGTNHESDQLLNIQLDRIPAEMLGDGPHQNILKLISKTSAGLSESGNDFELKVQMSVIDGERAEQVRQVAQGLMGLLALSSSMDIQESGLSDLRTLLKNLETKREGNDVEVNILVNGSHLTRLIDKELN